MRKALILIVCALLSTPSLALELKDRTIILSEAEAAGCVEDGECLVIPSKTYGAALATAAYQGYVLGIKHGQSNCGRAL